MQNFTKVNQKVIFSLFIYIKIVKYFRTRNQCSNINNIISKWAYYINELKKKKNKDPSFACGNGLKTKV